MRDHYKFVQATLQRLTYTSSDFIFTHCIIIIIYFISIYSWSSLFKTMNIVK